MFIQCPSIQDFFLFFSAALGAMQPNHGRLSIVLMRTLLEREVRGISQRELTHLISSDPNTVASLLERMEAARLIERKPHEKDRRAHRIRLLAKGKRKYEQARQVALALQTEILSVL